MSGEVLGQFVREYLQRVVNERDVTAVDDMVRLDYCGSGRGWPADIAGLREFYQRQARSRPDWRIDVQETVEVGEWVAVRAYAGGTVVHSDAGAPLPSSFRTLEWLTAYRVIDDKIAEIRVISVVDGPAT
jgi:hypothetical protein